MNSEQVPNHFRTTEMTTRYKIIPKLVGREQIEIADYRPGQKQFLSYNPKNRFEALLTWLSELNKQWQFLRLQDPTKIKSETEAIESYEKMWIPNIRGLEQQIKIILFETDSHLRNTNAAKILYDKIFELWKNMSLKDSKITWDIKHLKQYVESKKQG